MKLKLTKSNMKVLPELLLYLMAIVFDIVNKAVFTYVFIGLIVIRSVFMLFSTNKKHRSGFITNYKYILVYLVIVEVFTMIFNYSMALHSVVKEMLCPLFVVGTVIIGYEYNNQHDEGKVSYFLQGTLIIILVAAVGGIYEYIFHRNIFIRSYDIITSGRVASFYNHPIKYATSMIIAFYITLYNVKNKLLKYVLLILFSFGLFSSMSRSGWLAFAITTSIIIIATLKDKITARRLFGVTFVFFIFMSFWFTSAGQSLLNAIIVRFGKVGTDTSTFQRLGSVEYVFNSLRQERNIATFLLGHGEGASGRLMMNAYIVWKNFGMTDNQYLMILYDYGFIALVAVLTFMITSVMRFIARYQELSKTTKVSYCIVISQFINAFFYEITNYRNCAFIVLMCIGMVLYDKRHTRQIKRTVIGA